MALAEEKIHSGVWCRVCDREKLEGNHWFRVITEPHRHFTVVDFTPTGPGNATCSMECVATWFSTWADELRDSKVKGKSAGPPMRVSEVDAPDNPAPKSLGKR